MAERHLKHKETLRSGFKPKGGEAQRDDRAGIYGVNDAPAIYTIARQAVRMPGYNTDTLFHFLYFSHHYAKDFPAGALGAFRLLKFP
ncbi:MAG: hypothetical protein PHE24_06900 [Patescibacteria group bacterium]|nr:hypothetical protein [Patescibacteria group bacterium]